MSFYFQAVGEGIASLILASCRQIIFLLPLNVHSAALLRRLNGLWLTFPAPTCWRSVVTATWTLRSFKKYEIPFKMHPAPDVIEGGNIFLAAKKPAVEVDISEP